jgi:hypothetical protein
MMLTTPKYAPRLPPNKESTDMQQIAAQKKRENIAEYLLFLWQMEDLLRGVDLDADRLAHTVLDAVEDEALRTQSLEWLRNLARRMRSERLEVSGHLSETYDILAELQLLENTLLTVLGDEAFRRVHAAAKPVIDEFRRRSDKVPRSNIESALTATYGFMLLRLSGKAISEETTTAVRTLTGYLARLAASYRELQNGTLPLHN